MTDKNNIDTVVEERLGKSIKSRSRLGGGDFAESYCVTLDDDQKLFVKTHRSPPPNFFSTEATGLQWLARGPVAVPEVVLVSDDPPMLALQWIEIGHEGADTERLLGEGLAELHQLPFECFGRPDSRTTGSQALPNTPHQTWVDFFAGCRLLPLAKIASDRGVLPAGVVAGLESIAKRLDEFGAADEPAALLHGDLWAGNRVVDQEGKSWLIDPAAHGGHREFDLAMMRLFGGYGEDCFAAYHEAYPLQAGWQERVSLHQLAPLVVHAIKFGGHYVGATEKVVRDFC